MTLVGRSSAVFLMKGVTQTARTRADPPQAFDRHLCERPLPSRALAAVMGARLPPAACYLDRGGHPPCSAACWVRGSAVIATGSRGSCVRRDDCARNLRTPYDGTGERSGAGR